MEQKKKKGAVLKGLAFPVGYTVFMNVVQGGAIALIAVFCLIRVLLGFLSATDMGHEYFMQMFTQDYANTVSNLTWLLSALTTALALVILWLVFNRKDKSFIEYFRFKPTSLKAILTAVLLGLSLFFLVNGIMTILQVLGIGLLQTALELLYELDPEMAQSLEELYNVYMESMNASQGDMGMFVIAAVLGAPLIEEIVFRAGPLTNLTRRMRPLPAIMITAALFGLAHGAPAQVVYTFVLGIIMGFLFVKTDSIYPSIICHFVFNGANLISIIMGELFNTEIWLGNPYYDDIAGVLNGLSEITFWLYLVLSILVAIPMMIVGIILLVSLRRPQPKAEAVEVAPTAGAVEAAQATAPVAVAEIVAEAAEDAPAEPVAEATEEPVEETAEVADEVIMEEPVEEVAPLAEEAVEEIPQEVAEEAVDEQPAEETV